MTVSKATGPMWNEVDDTPDPNIHSVDDQVEMRCKTKRLADCELPEGFRLATPAPRQYWLDHQLRWAFELRFGDHKHVARYHQQVSDEMRAPGNRLSDIEFRKATTWAAHSSKGTRGPAEIQSRHPMTDEERFVCCFVLVMVFCCKWFFGSRTCSYCEGSGVYGGYSCKCCKGRGIR